MTRSRNDGLDMDTKDIENMLEYPIIGIIPEDNNVRKAMVLKNPVTFLHPRSEASVAYRKLAANLTGNKYEERKEKKKGFFSKLFGF